MQDNNLSYVVIEEEEKSIDFRSIFVKLVSHWKWFIISFIFCTVVSFIYLRYQTPLYEVKSSILIKEQDSQKSNFGVNGAIDVLQDLGGFSMSKNFDNEIQILKSTTLIQKVVENLGLYINTVEKRTFGYAKPLYKNSPVNVYITPEEASKIEGSVKLAMTYSPDGKLKIKGNYVLDGDKYTFVHSFDSLPGVYPSPVGVFSFAKNKLDKKDIDGTVKLVSIVSTPEDVASVYAQNLSVEPVSKTTTIANLSLKESQIERAKDFTNQLVAFYNQDANDEKNEVARNSARFIEERIAIINGELGTTENELANFKKRSGLTDLTSDAKLALEENSKYEQQRTLNATQIRLVKFLDDYINNPDNRNGVIPSNVGLEDKNLSTIIDQYNTLIIERKRLLRTSSENNPAVINLNTGIDAMRHSVQTTVQSVLQGLQITQKDIERQSSKYEARINDAPDKEKKFISISRQQEIKATLYIMLLQKREENAITLAATANNGRVIEKARAAKQPDSPKKHIVMLVSLLMSLGLPVVVIYVLELLKYKVESREDIVKITDVSVLAELPHAETNKDNSIVVRSNMNDVMEETFRTMRTNAMFMLNEDEKVILVTSTDQQDGKSFVSSNFAVSMALLGKKVIIVGMDIRKPGLNKTFGFSCQMEGVTKYLNNPEKTDLSDLIFTSSICPNLDILPGGTVPPNPTELLARPSLGKLIDTLKSKYEYVILDTAPVGLVSDTAIMGHVADLCVYVCRANKTTKKDYSYINVLKKEGRFKKMATVICDVNIEKTTKRYGYGYGYDSDKKSSRK